MDRLYTIKFHFDHYYVNTMIINSIAMYKPLLVKQKKKNPAIGGTDASITRGSALYFLKSYNLFGAGFLPAAGFFLFSVVSTSSFALARIVEVNSEPASILAISRTLSSAVATDTWE
ncbi:hypothetical protein DSECCO2_249530 [anaerobic digester metagenome]